MLREQEIFFKQYALIDDDLDRRELDHFIPRLYTDAILTLMICFYCGGEQRTMSEGMTLV